MSELALLVLAAFAAGALNTLAGGGTFLTLPALLAAGYPPIVANATSGFAVAPGYASGTAGYARELRQVSPAKLAVWAISVLAGGLCGALLLRVTPNDVFLGLVPVLMALATALFAFGGRLSQTLARWRLASPPLQAVGLFAVAVYGGYFNGGVGIALMALFALWGITGIHQANALKMFASLVLAVISVSVFALSGLIVWQAGLAMAAAALAGGYAGVPLARWLPDAVVRAGIIVTGGVMTVVFAVRAWG